MISQDISEPAETVMLFYITSIPQAVGVAYQPPDLTFLAYHCLQSSGKYFTSIWKDTLSVVHSA